MEIKKGAKCKMKDFKGLMMVLLTFIMAMSLQTTIVTAETNNTVEEYYKHPEEAYTKVDSEGNVYTLEDGYVVKRNKNKEIAWKYEYDVPFDTVEDLLISDQGYVYIQTWEEIISITPSGNKNWEFRTQIDSISEVVIDKDETIYFIENEHDSNYYDPKYDGYSILHAFNNKGQKQWSYRTENLWNITLGQKEIHVLGNGSEHSKYYAFDKAGNIKRTWEQRLSFPIDTPHGQGDSAPGVSKDGEVYVMKQTVDNSYNLSAYDTNGVLKWEKILPTNINGTRIDLWWILGFTETGNVILTGEHLVEPTSILSISSHGEVSGKILENTHYDSSFEVHNNEIYSINNNELKIYNVNGSLIKTYTGNFEDFHGRFSPVLSQDKESIYITANTHFANPSISGNGVVYKIPKTSTPIDIQKGWKNINGTWYYFDPQTGIKKTGWLLYQNQWYYLDQNGAMATGWVQSGGKRYFMDNSGTMMTGWVQSGGKWYFMDNNGVMTTGWVQSGGKWYFMDNSGTMVTGWVQSGGKWYFMDNSGTMVTGWVQSGGKWYFMDNGGTMVTGWVQSGSKWYYMYNNGQMATNTVIHGYRLGSDGAWIR